MVGIAVSDVGLCANGDLGRDLVANVVIAANLLVLDVDVGVELVELNDVVIKNCAEVCTHCVIELNGDLAAVVGERLVYFVLVSCYCAFALGCFGLVKAEVDVTANERKSGEKHSSHQKNC